MSFLLPQNTRVGLPLEYLVFVRMFLRCLGGNFNSQMYDHLQHVTTKRS